MFSNFSAWCFDPEGRRWSNKLREDHKVGEGVISSTDFLGED